MNPYDQRFTGRAKSPEVNQFNRAPVTILIPQSLLSHGRRFLTLNSGAACLHRLMRRHGPALIHLCTSRRVRGRMTYQRPGQDLVRCQFRVSETSWARLSALAYGSGMSRCAVFTWMLERELDSSVRVPTPGQQRIPFVNLAATLAVLSHPKQIVRTMSIREFMPYYGWRAPMPTSGSRAAPKP